MDPMYLADVENHPAAGTFGEKIAAARAQGMVIPQIWHLFAFRPAMTEHLAAFTQEAMRGPSPLSPGLRELIAAYTSRRNDCLF
jgi:alkylhydroperoxidase family enzyme